MTFPHEELVLFWVEMQMELGGSKGHGKALNFLVDEKGSCPALMCVWEETECLGT